LDELVKIGFVKNGIVETIVSTFDKKRNPLAAPMGVSTEDKKNIILSIFKSTQTFVNLKERQCGVVNITSDPTLFHSTLFKDVNPDKKIPTDWFIPASLVDAPYLRNADAFIEFRVTNLTEFGEKIRVLCRVEKISVIHKNLLQVYQRAKSAVIESLIHATRIEVFLASGEEKKAKELMALVNHYSKIVNKVTPNSTYSQIMTDIQHRIKKWSRKE
tara:strand:- start:1497 stop:2144 length:648 start_codon:yes stop_codon:yes gene_type:complete